MSSVAKNFDTLMERAFAETLNLRLRLPGLVMGEVYVPPIVEYDDVAMRTNRVAWKKKPIPVEKSIRRCPRVSWQAAGSCAIRAVASHASPRRALPLQASQV